MGKVYTRLRINETYRAANTDDLADLGGFSIALRKGQVSYAVTIRLDGRLIKTEKHVFNAKGESIDHWHEVQARSFQEAESRMSAFWEVFIDQHRVWFGNAKQLFDHSIQSGRSPRQGGGAALWSTAHIAMSRAHSLLSKPGQVNQTTIHISGCPHDTDGAIKVAEYIVQEIKTNAASQYAKDMYYYNDFEGRLKEWQSLPAWQRALNPVPQPMLSLAMVIWTERVAENRPWDHKPIIRQRFKGEAVKRLTSKGIESESHYHKYKDHDYFLDVWSNIHYGYVGMSSGFTEDWLLDGAGLEQIGSNVRHGIKPKSSNETGRWRDYDDLPDRVSIQLGIRLFKQYGRYANGLTATTVLNALEGIPREGLDNSRVLHVCLDQSPNQFTPD